MPQGFKNSGPWFQMCLEGVLGELLWRAIIQYLDDSLLHAKGEKELLVVLEAYFDIMDQYNIKLHPAKFVLFAKKLTWCGKQVSKDGLRPAPHRTLAVETMPEPVTLADMMSFVYGTVWFRNHIVRFAEIAAPLYDLWKEALAPYKKKTKAMAKRFILREMPDWHAKGRAAFEAVKKALTEAIETSLFNPKLKTCVFGDASDEFWCLMITQCEPGVERLPWADQDGKHRVLVIESGRFRNAQLRWAIVDNEGYVFGEKIHKWSHWVNGGLYKSAFFTDHRNLLSFFDDDVRPATCTKPNRQRLTRWGLNLRSLWYEIFPIAGDVNYISDIGTRWGNRYAVPNEGPDGKVSVKALLRTWMREEMESRARPKCVLRLPEPKTHPDKYAPDIDARKDLMLNMDTLGLNLVYVREQQDKYRKQRPKKLKVGAGNVWRTADGKVWVPKRAKALKNALYAVAHQGPCVHRGFDVTLGLLNPHFFWDNLERDVRARHVQCLQCIKATHGEKVPRPMGTQLLAEYAGEVLMMDYILIWPSETGNKYVLIQCDKISRLVQFVVTEAPTAVPACRGVVSWGSKYGLPEWLITDGGTHFANHAMRLVAEKLKVDHHITLAHCPWANGSVEVVGRALLRSIRVILSELHLVGLEKWEHVVELINLGLNYMHRAVLGGRSPLEVMTGRKVKSPVELVLWCGTKLKDATKITAPLDMVQKHCDKVAQALDIMHTELKDSSLVRQRKQAAKEAETKFKGAYGFQVGDLVMVAAANNSANVQKRSKIMCKWQGPYQVTSKASVSEFDVVLLGSPLATAKRVHWTRMKRFAGPDFGNTADLIEGAQHDLHKFYVESFVDWKMVGDDRHLLVQWRGLKQTWEDAVQLHEDVPEKVMDYLREHIDEDDALKLLHAALRAKEASGARKSSNGGRGRGGRGRGGRGRGGCGRGGRGRGGCGRGGRGRGGRARGRGGNGRGGRGRGRGGRGRGRGRAGSARGGRGRLGRGQRRR